MNEKLLQFIWQFQYYNTIELLTQNDERLVIIKPGKLNTNQGPDFSDAIIKIERVQLAGNIEVHFKASDWLKHAHQKDPNYNNIILHVVWINDIEITTANKSKIPVLVLEGLVPRSIMQRYVLMMNTPVIPCQNSSLPTLDALGWFSWKERLLAERLERKSTQVSAYLEKSKQHWEQVFWVMLAANFGMKINSELFETMAQSISVNILAKHKNQIHQIEALLLGQANLLNDNFTDEYAIQLQKEYHFSQKKYQLQPITIQPNYLRMRPANFPTIRLAQLAMLVHHSVHLFSKIKEQNSLKDAKVLFEVTASGYWNNHYQFDKQTDYAVKNLGQDTIDNILINTVVPLLFAYGLHMQDELIKDKAIKWLTEIKRESNAIVKKWHNPMIIGTTAFDSQALIELTNNYCTKKRCLECAVGNRIFKT